MPKASSVANIYVPLINRFADEFGVNTKLQMAYVLATIAIESGELMRTVENMNYSASRLLVVFPKYFNGTLATAYANKPMAIGNRVYANRMGNGNEQSGDGFKYRGRGLIQITGKNMYILYSKYCGVDLTEQPELLASPFGATRSAFWYICKYARLLPVADRDDAKAFRKAVNGGYNGFSDFIRYVDKCKRVLV